MSLVALVTVVALFVALWWGSASQCPEYYKYLPQATSPRDRVEKGSVFVRRNYFDAPARVVTTVSSSAVYYIRFVSIVIDCK